MAEADPMPKRGEVGLGEALSIALGTLPRMTAVSVSVEEACGLVVAEDLFARVDSPSSRSSLRDGYAVASRDLEGAGPAHPARLRVAGVSAAGDRTAKSVVQGLAVKVMTGARLPEGADAVIEVEFTREVDGDLLCYREAPPGKNVLDRGSDVSAGERLTVRGQILTPGLTGLLAAGGLCRIPVIPMPRVGVLATGDEVAAPGEALEPGRLYASNLVTLISWLRRFGMEARCALAGDRPDELGRAFTEILPWADVLLTSGGAWRSERDMTIRVLQEMGCHILFRGVRMLPGKAAAFGMIRGKGVFFLPGAPPSNEMAFLQIALPALLHMGGKQPIPFPLEEARLAHAVKGEENRTRFHHAALEKREGAWWAIPLWMKSRLHSQARAQAIIPVPEGEREPTPGDWVTVQVLTSP